MRNGTRTRLVFASSRRFTRVTILGGILALIVELGPIRILFGQSAAYVVTELTGEDAIQVPSNLNNLGDIVGRKAGNGKGASQATVWSHDRSSSKHLGVLPGGDYSSATGINDAGEITGASNAETAILPFLWTEKSGLRRLPLRTGDTCGQAAGINKFGHVVCYSSGPNGSRAFLWTRKTGVRELAVLPGGSYSRARGLNDSDEAAGVSDSPAGERAVLWTKSGTVRDLGTLPGDWASEAMAINNAGDVVGYSRGPNGMRAFIWTKSGGIMEELGILSGGKSSRALDINDVGLVVGSSDTSSGDHAFVWRRENGMLDLNDAASAAGGAVLVEAHAINRKGEILAMGMAHGPMASEDQVCAPAPPLSFLLTPRGLP